MRIEGEKLRDWEAFLAARHTLYANRDGDICGPLLYDHEKQALTCRHEHSRVGAAEIKATLQALGFDAAITQTPVSRHFVECDYTIKSLDPERLKPEPLSREALRRLKNHLERMAQHLQNAFATLDTPIEHKAFPASVKAALATHRLPNDNPLQNAYIEEIAQRAAAGIPASLPLYDVLRLNGWQKAGSREALEYYDYNHHDLKHMAHMLKAHGATISELLDTGQVADQALQHLPEFADAFKRAQSTLGAIRFIVSQGSDMPDRSSLPPFKPLSEHLQAASVTAGDVTFRKQTSLLPLCLLHAKALGQPALEMAPATDTPHFVKIPYQQNRYAVGIEIPLAESDQLPRMLKALDALPAVTNAHTAIKAVRHGAHFQLLYALRDGDKLHVVQYGDKAATEICRQMNLAVERDLAPGRSL